MGPFCPISEGRPGREPGAGVTAVRDADRRRLKCGGAMTQAVEQQKSRAGSPSRVPWSVWPLYPLILLVGVPVLLLLVLLVLLLTPLFVLYPDRVRQLHDVQGTPRQRELLARWRAAYRRLGPWGRVGRAVKVGRRSLRSRIIGHGA